MESEQLYHRGYCRNSYNSIASASSDEELLDGAGVIMDFHTTEDDNLLDGDAASPGREYGKLFSSAFIGQNLDILSFPSRIPRPSFPWTLSELPHRCHLTALCWSLVVSHRTADACVCFCLVPPPPSSSSSSSTVLYVKPWKNFLLNHPPSIIVLLPFSPLKTKNFHSYLISYSLSRFSLRTINFFLFSPMKISGAVLPNMIVFIN